MGFREATSAPGPMSFGRVPIDAAANCPRRSQARGGPVTGAPRPTDPSSAAPATSARRLASVFSFSE